METVFKFIATIILTISCLQGKSQADNEIKIYNSLIDSLYELNTCFKIIYPPFYKCCDSDTLYGDDMIKCCENSSVPKQYRIYCPRCANKQDFDTSNVLMVVTESFSTLDIKQDKKYLLSQVDKNSIYYDFIKSIKKPTPSRQLPADSIKQQNIKFITKKEFDRNGFIHRYGKTGKQILLGYFDFSRIYIDNAKKLGLCKINWVGGGTCGYDKYFLIYRENGIWKLYKRIWKGVY